MSRSALLPLGVGASAPDALSLLHRRLLLAEEEAEALIQDMGALGVSRDQILGSAERIDATQCPGSPLKMRRCDSLVSRVCRIESLLQTLKLTVFRLETERELDPSHTAHLEQQLAALQQQSEEERQASRRELMKLGDHLQRVCEERDEARTEVQKLGETVEVAAAAKMDVALAAEELKIVKVEMSQKLMEMEDQMRQESARAAEATKSHSELLQRLEEMERAAETERRQALMLQSDCQALRVKVRSSRQQLDEEEDRGRQLEERCQRLKQHTAMKDSLVTELRGELKNVHLALQRQQTENSKLQTESRELRSAADRVQMLNEQLQSQCSQLTAALRSLSVENEKQQASLKAERSCVDLLQEAARRDIQTDLQVALTDKVNLQLELEKLKGEHAELLQSSFTAPETAAAQRELLERTIERLRGELSTAKKAERAMRKDLEGSKNELCLVVTKLEGERSNLKTQLREAQDALQMLDQKLKDLTDKNKPTNEKGHLKIGELEAVQSVCGPAGSVVSQNLENLAASHTGLQLKSQTLQRELATLKTDRLQAQREIRKHQEEVEKLQRLLTSTHSKNSRALQSLQKASDNAKVDNRRLAHSLEQALLTNSSLQHKLEQARDQYQATITLREEELREARTQICHLSEELGAVRRQTRDDYESSIKTLHREISELKHTVKDSSSGSGDLSKTNRELRLQVSELERLVSKQKACVREHRRQLRQQRKSRDLQDDSQKVEVREAEWEKWTSTIQRWEAKRELAHIAGGSKPASVGFLHAVPS